MGIGTASPQQPLHIFTTVNNVLTLQRDSNSGIAIQFENNQANKEWFLGTYAKEDFGLGNLIK